MRDAKSTNPADKEAEKKSKREFKRRVDLAERWLVIVLPVHATVNYSETGVSR